MTLQGETPPEAASPPEKPAEQEGRAAALPLQLELPSAATEPSRDEPKARVRVRFRFTVGPFVVAAALLVLAALAATAVSQWLLPWYVRRASIEAAAAHGIQLSIEEVRIRADGFRLVGVHAACPAVAGARAEATEVDVETSRMRPRRISVRAAEVTLSGSLAAVDLDLAGWVASQASDSGANAIAPASWTVDATRVVWRSVVGDNVTAEAANTHVELAWPIGSAAKARGPAVELNARSDKVMISTPGGPLGPWRVDIERLPSSSRVRVALDPGVPEACTILVVGDGRRITSIDVVVPRSPLTHLGVSKEWLGVAADAIQLDATFHYVALGPARADANARGGVYGIVVPGLPRPIDLAWEASLSGNPTTGIDVKKARLAVGPLVGALSGTIKDVDGGLRIDLAWAAGPVPCAAFAVPLGLGQPFDIAYELRKLVGGAPPHGGAGGHGGDVSATGMLTFDSRDLGVTKVAFAPDPPDLMTVPDLNGARCRGRP